MKKGLKKRRGYDTQMIRDFLDHLLWEVRIDQAESTHLQSTADPVLCGKLKPHMARYGTGLLVATSLEVSEDDMDVAFTAWRAKQKYHAEMSGKYIDALELLAPLFKEALMCAARGGVLECQRTPEAILSDPWPGHPGSAGFVHDPRPVLPDAEREPDTSTEVSIREIFDGDGLDRHPSSDAPRLIYDADLVIAVDATTRKEALVFGRRALKRYRDSGKRTAWLVVRVILETGQDKDDLDRLCAVLKAVRGKHDYSGFQEPPKTV